MPGALPMSSPSAHPFALSWRVRTPGSRTGRRLADMDAIIVVHVIPPPVIPAHHGTAAGRRRRPARRRPASARARSSSRTTSCRTGPPGDRQLLTAFFSRVDSVVVHKDAQTRLATELGHGTSANSTCHPSCPVARRSPPCPGQAPLHPALGIVRDYKGVVTCCPRPPRRFRDVTVTVAGEMWGDAAAPSRELARDPRLQRTGSRSTGGCPRRPDPRVARPARRPGPHSTAMPRRPRTSLPARRHGSLRHRVVGRHLRFEQVRDEVDGLLVPPATCRPSPPPLTRLADPFCYAAQLRSLCVPSTSGALGALSGAL